MGLAIDYSVLLVTYVLFVVDDFLLLKWSAIEVKLSTTNKTTPIIYLFDKTKGRTDKWNLLKKKNLFECRKAEAEVRH